MLSTRRALDAAATCSASFSLFSICIVVCLAVLSAMFSASAMANFCFSSSRWDAAKASASSSTCAFNASTSSSKSRTRAASLRYSSSSYSLCFFNLAKLCSRRARDAAAASSVSFNLRSNCIVLSAAFSLASLMLSLAATFTLSSFLAPLSAKRSASAMANSFSSSSFFEVARAFATFAVSSSCSSISSSNSRRSASALLRSSSVCFCFSSKLATLFWKLALDAAAASSASFNSLSNCDILFSASLTVALAEANKSDN
mmetsp:Transcript_33973/g.62967  ORF Transcript_33973/g.62967 Transcript_33973/m.62967 type:complete len:258 (-) Transcript_33973:45-818(-)